MSGTTVLTIAITALVFLAVLTVFTTARRRDTGHALSRETVKRDRSDSPFLTEEHVRVVGGREVERAAALARRAPGKEVATVGSASPVPYVPPDLETLGVSRRQFLNRSLVAMTSLGLAGFGASVLAFLWPSLSGGFGSKVSVGKLEDILASVRDTRKPFYVPEGRFYLNPFPPESVGNAEATYSPAVLPGMQAGVVALYQKCVHLGCRVPWCDASQWFECPCHGSQYNRVGERKGGPAPRGLDHFVVEISGGVVAVDTKTVIEGPPIGTNTTGQEAEGPHCVGSAGGGE